MDRSGPTEEEIREALGVLKLRMTSELGTDLARLVLYGSRARGDHDERSDIDVALVVHGLDSRRKNEILDLIGDIEIEYLVPMSVLVLSESDFEALKKRERRIALDIEREGIPL